MEEMTAHDVPRPPWPIPFRYGVTCFIGLALLEAALAFAAGRLPGSGEYTVYLFTFLARTADIVLVVVFLRVRGLEWSGLGLHRRTWRRGVVHAVYWGAACGAAAAIVYVPRIIALCASGHCPGFALPLTPFAAFMSIVYGPMVEEVVFRGWLYGALRNRLPVAVSVPLGALVFAAPHGLGLVPFSLALAGGILFCVSYERSRSLLTPILLHVCGNTAFLVLEKLTG